MTNGLFSIFRLHPTKDGVGRQRAGRILVKEGQPIVLEDPHSQHLRSLAADPDRFPHRFARLRVSPYHQVVRWDDHLGDGTLDDLPQADLKPLPVERGGPPARPAPVFEYHRAGHDQPHLLEAAGDALTLDGNALSPAESAKIMENVRGGAATLRYKQQPAGEPVNKAEGSQGPTGEPQGLPEPDLEHDPSIPRLKNLYALSQRQPKEGERVTCLDLNDFSRIEDEVGWREGDDAVRAYGELVAKHGGKDSYRDGGDSFTVFHATPEDQQLFLRALQEAVRELLVVGGKFRMTASFGGGEDYAAARAALVEAKLGKLGQDGELRDSTIVR